MITSTGFLVLGGKDASQNISLLRKYAENDDIVMHADIHGASAVVIKARGKEIDEKTLREAAVLAACYSKAWKLGLNSVDVFWVKRNQISFSPPAGEYLPKGGFMVYGKKNYIRNVELRLAIGIEIVDNSYRIIIGPEEVVSLRAIAYMVIVPGEVDPSTIAKAFISELGKIGLKELANSIDINEIIKRIPGKSKTVKVCTKSEQHGAILC
ncbi:MAG TPA: DUF814 domain-containing protein [Ignisphaera sp.]|nr:DUF814 domain-containing protein [Ignisphaera sp.]